MNREQLKKRIDTACGRIVADLVIKNCNVIDVYSHCITKSDIAICDGIIAGIGSYKGIKEIDAEGKYACAGFIDGHIHIESSYVSPEEFCKMTVPCGTSTVIADPHEIVNVSGFDGLDYMLKASENCALDIKYMLPSCVPATPYETSGAVIKASDMDKVISGNKVLGLGEFMNFVGVVNTDDDVLDKLIAADKVGKVVDGHSPSLKGKELSAYIGAGISTDHECSDVEEMNERISNGMYVLMREGSVCHNLRQLLKGVTQYNSSRCLLCSDDRQPKTMLTLGHLNNHLKICVEEGIDAITAIQMATINVAQCYRLYDRGAIAPGKKADIVLLDNLTDFSVSKMFINGKLVAEDGKYIPEINKFSIDTVRRSMFVKDFSREKLKTKITTGKANVIEIIPEEVITRKTTCNVKTDGKGNFIFEKDKDLAKIAIVERHKGTGNVAVGLLKGYGIKNGAVAISIAHDSHNIVCVGVSDTEMETAVNELIKQEGGIVLVNDGKVIDSMPMPIAGLMSDKSGEWVDKRLTSIHKKAYEILEVSRNFEPVMTLCFLSLAVIPEVKITDKGLFDVTQQKFIDLEA